MEHLLKMNKYVVKTKDKIVENEVKDLDRFLIDVQEEIMDALLYIQAARTCLRDEIEEAMLNRSKHFNDNISNIELDEEEIL